jgi:hypothetical protein
VWPTQMRFGTPAILGTSTFCDQKLGWEQFAGIHNFDTDEVPFCIEVEIDHAADLSGITHDSPIDSACTDVVL